MAAQMTTGYPQLMRCFLIGVCEAVAAAFSDRVCRFQCGCSSHNVSHILVYYQRIRGGQVQSFSRQKITNKCEFNEQIIICFE